MIYAKLVNGNIVYSPKLVNGSCILSGMRVFNPTKSDYVNAGYKEVTFLETPVLPEYKKLKKVYTEQEDKIVVSYEIIDMTDEEKQSYDQKVLQDKKAYLLMKVEEAKEHITEQYNTALNTQFAYEDYLVKPMFLEKYSKAYISLLDDVDAGVDPQVVNVSIYTDANTLVNIDLSFDQFKDIYRAVKTKALLIEKEYQQALAELTELLQITDLTILEQKINEILNISINL